MQNPKNFIIKYNRITAPLLAVAFSTLALFAAIYVYEAFLFLIPVIVFFSFHFTKLYRLRTRILGGLVIFIIVAMISAGISTSVIYTTDPVVTDHYTNLSVQTQVTPYAGNYSSYNFTMKVMDRVQLNPDHVTLDINTTGFQKNVSAAEMSHYTNASGDQVFYYVYTNPPAGIYSYNFTFQNQTGATLYTGFGTGSGPDTLSSVSTFKELFIVTVINDVIIFEIILVAGIFIARSFSRSARNRIRPPQRPKQPDIVDQNNNQ
ncbi:hypothetical protein OXIME_001673 [Oxyplasma meridianum]|uniref:Uncharacterized protein n=1 Tax=Oxyplasma meridianum TaxID=3073602 RepID=A0AAX4NHQ2_9ARCH